MQPSAPSVATVSNAALDAAADAAVALAAKVVNATAAAAGVPAKDIAVGVVETIGDGMLPLTGVEAAEVGAPVVPYLESAAEWQARYDKEIWISTNFMGWVYIGYAAFALLWVVYGLFRASRNNSFAKTNGPNEATRLLMFETETVDVSQAGFYSPWYAKAMKWLTVASAILANVFLFVIFFSEAVIDENDAHILWDYKAKAFIMAWCLTATIFTLMILCQSALSVAYLFATSLESCTHVVIWRRDEDSGEENEADILSRRVAELTAWIGGWVGQIGKGWQRFILKVESPPDSSVRYFDLMCTRYVFSPTQGVFQSSEGQMAMGVREVQTIVKQGGLIEGTVTRRLQDHGDNTILVKVPSLIKSLGRGFWDPIFLFQYMVIWNSIYFRCYFTGLLWIIMAAWGIFIQTILIRGNQMLVHEMTDKASRAPVEILREGTKQTIEARHLVPGDVVMIEDDSDVPADIALIKGHVVTNESNLTGEAIPVQKFELPITDDLLAPEGKGGKTHYLFAGTKVITNVGSASEVGGQDRKSVGVVVRTGAATSKGQLIRDILYPNQFRFKYIDQLPVVAVICTLFGLSIMTIYICAQGSGAVGFFLGLTSVSQVVPIWVQVILAVGQNVAAKRLANEKGIFCLAPARIAICGKIRVMCWDKTGTLTKDGIDFIGVHPTDPAARTPAPKVLEDASSTGTPSTSVSAAFTSVVSYEAEEDKPLQIADGSPPTGQKAVAERELRSKVASGGGADFSCFSFSQTVSAGLLQGLACCHALAPIVQNGKEVLIGSELERKMHVATGWKIENGVISPPVCVVEGPGRHSGALNPLKVMKVYEFDHVRQTMGVILKDTKTGELKAYIKGSYEKIADLTTTGLPPNYMKVAQAHAKEGKYVLAMSCRTLDSSIDPETFPRVELEKDAHFLGLILFRNELKPETPEALRELREGKVRPVIITGDNALTAIAVARMSGIIRRSDGLTSANAKGTNPTSTAKQLSHQTSETGTSALTSSLTGHPVLLGDIVNGQFEWRDTDTNELIDEDLVYSSDRFKELALTAAGFEYLLDGEEGQTRSRTRSSDDEGQGNGSSDEEDEFEVGSDVDSQASISTVGTESNGKQLTKRRRKPARRSKPLDSILLRIRIFARMNPHGKVAAIKQFMERGYVTGMCGDGGNDCGALRAAHAGISLSDAEASIVSPFNAKSKKSSAVPELLKEGRGSLVTSMAGYKMYTVYGILTTFCRMPIQLVCDAGLPDLTFFLTDALVMMLLAQTMTLARPKKRLASRSPTSSLLGPATIISVVSTIVIDLFFLAILFFAMNKYFGFPFPRQWNSQFPSHAWWIKGDNFETEAVTLFFVTQLCISALIFTFGGQFRRNAFKNLTFTTVWLSILSLLGVLLLFGPSYFHCLFRINCDDATSRITESKFLHFFAHSADGGPFNGEWGHNIMPWDFKIFMIVLNVVCGLTNILFHKFVIDGWPAEFYRTKYPHKFPGKTMPV